MTSSKILFWFCIVFVVGIGAGSLVKIPQMVIWGILVAAAFIIIFCFICQHCKYASLHICSVGMVLGFCILFLVLGILRLQIAEFYIANDAVRKLNDKSEKITLMGQVIDEPDIRNSFQKVKVKIQGTKSVVLVALGRYVEYGYLDTIKITGNLKTPMVTEDFSYKNYLLKDGIYSVMDFPKTELVSNKREYAIFSFLYEKILEVKGKLRKSIDENFSQPENFIVEGVILGEDKNMPKDLKNQFNASGLSHVTALSGGNIVILISILVPFLLMLGLWRGQAFYFSIIFIWLYIIMAGLPASGIRAAIMGSIFLLAEKLGRQGTASRVIVLAAALMLLQNPLLLLYDIGFQLSFLASMGIIYIRPIIDSKIPKFKTNKKSRKDILYKKLNFLLDIVSVTLAAQIAVLPIIIYNFGNVSLVSPITNLLILPIIPPLMVFGFISAVFGIFSPPVGGFLGWVFYLPSHLLLVYFLKVLNVFHKPWALYSLNNISWIWAVLYYIVLSISIWHYNKSKKLKFLEY